MLIDEAKIFVHAGNGGDGAVSFRREKFVPKGGPDGGDGGDGGNVYIICERQVHTLSEFFRKKGFRAERGKDGSQKKKHGKNGQNLFLKAPPGTVVYDDSKNVIFDFKKEGEKILVAKGGKGGWGNVHFATSTSQSPTFAKKGTEGEEKKLKLELKILADVGLIGLPNAGKSTFLSVVSNARPKIADYPFTTLEPNLGVVKIHNKELIFADIPGLILGASQGKGLGDKFLRHIERTNVLLHLIDINSSNPKKDYQDIRIELEAWSKDLLKKKEIVVLNKADTLNDIEAQKIAKKLSQDIKKPVIIISAVSQKGVKELLNKIFNSNPRF